MAQNNGNQNERDIVALLNGKRVNELPDHFRVWLKTFYEDENTKLRVSKLNNEQKADIFISNGKIKTYISIKSGTGNSFHCEQIATFIPFLRSIGVSERTLKTIAFFHYGDRTLNGTGRIRFTSAELRRSIPSFLKSANQELTKTEIMEHIIERCIIKGRYPNNFKIDGVYHGTVDEGFFVPAALIYKILSYRTHIRKNGTLNMHMLSYQPGCRNLSRIAELEPERNTSKIMWRSFEKDARIALNI